MSARTIQCPACLAPTDVDPETSIHGCGYCSHQFFVAATEAGKALITRETSERLEPYHQKIDELREIALLSIERGRPDLAEQIMRERLDIYGAIYRQTNYYGLMGLCGEAQYVKYEASWLAQEMDSLPGWQAQEGQAQGGQVQVSESQSAYASALVDRSFPALLPALQEMMWEQIAKDPEWRERSQDEVGLEVQRYVHEHCWQLTWITDDQLRSIGMRFSSASKDPVSGVLQSACAYCGAPVPCDGSTESIHCGHCGATSRVRLSEFGRLQAHGLSESDAQSHMAMQEAVSTEDMGKALETTRATTSAMAPAGTPRARELEYYYSRMMFPWLVERDAELVDHLQLADSKECRHCEQHVALAPDGEGVCPICQQG